ncbi:hypothetical protein AXG93_4492s1300 [Marchantia polymorpha subsp. ruderalis]|uniref:Uncharacterized protein n=1 Tax=Marchantia polymorpha subsp. ruderalis TaxID=1480154 RepID=A0A176W5F2_MARPO|nr:hypothetical protein AXG93_4492s1300 [Marchantia polymorpha subsp. ruderalis]
MLWVPAWVTGRARSGSRYASRWRVRCWVLVAYTSVRTTVGRYTAVRRNCAMGMGRGMGSEKMEEDEEEEGFPFDSQP